MIEISYKWRMKNNILTKRIIGLGYHKGNTNFGQSDFLSVIDEEMNVLTEKIVWAKMLFTSGTWLRRLKYIYKKTKNN